MKKATGLGRGLSALIGEAPPVPRSDSVAPGGVRMVDVARIRPNPSQPRQVFDEEPINELAASIAERGVLQPIIVRALEDGYELVAGERRWRAAQKAQLHEIPAIVRDFDDESSAEVALIENIQREDLNAIEEATAFRQLIDRYGHSQEVVGKLVGKSRSHIANLLRLLDLPDSVRLMLLRSDISMGHARAILTAPDPEALANEMADTIAPAMIPWLVETVYRRQQRLEILASPPHPLFSHVRLGRNDPCPCGSGQKYKKCCGAA